MGALLFIHNGNRYPFQRSRPPRRRPRYPSLGTLRQCRLRIVCFRAGAKAHSLHCISSSGKIIRFCRSPIMAYFPRAISSLGAGIQLSASIRHIERAAPANNRPYRVCCSTAMLPLMIRAAIQAARITKNRSRGITSLPVLGAAATQDEARGREAYFNGRSAPDESIGSSAANGNFIGPAALSVPLSLFTVHPFPWLPVSGSSPCPWRSSPVSSPPSAHDAPGENPPPSAL